MHVPGQGRRVRHRYVRVSGGEAFDQMELPVSQLFALGVLAQQGSGERMPS